MKWLVDSIVKCKQGTTAGEFYTVIGRYRRFGYEVTNIEKESGCVINQEAICMQKDNRHIVISLYRYRDGSVMDEQYKIFVYEK